MNVNYGVALQQFQYNDHDLNIWLKGNFKKNYIMQHKYKKRERERVTNNHKEAVE